MILAVSLSFDVGSLIAGKLPQFRFNEWSWAIFFYLFIDNLHFSYKLSHQIFCPFCLKAFGLFCCYCYYLLHLLTLVYPMYYKYFLFFFPFIFISWRLITLQYCSGFCHTLTWISHGFTCVPQPDPPPASLSIPSLWVFPVHQPWALVSSPAQVGCKYFLFLASDFVWGALLTSEENWECSRVNNSEG